MHGLMKTNGFIKGLKIIGFQSVCRGQIPDEPQTLLVKFLKIFQLNRSINVLTKHLKLSYVLCDSV